jgi:TonB family protein
MSLKRKILVIQIFLLLSGFVVQSKSNINTDPSYYKIDEESFERPGSHIVTDDSTFHKSEFDNVKEVKVIQDLSDTMYHKIGGESVERPCSLIVSGDSAFYQSDYDIIKGGKEIQDSSDAIPPAHVTFTTAPAIMSSTPPKYPPEAEKVYTAGEVWVRLWIDKVGNPRLAIVEKSTDKIFNDNALSAVMQWKFSPALLNGKAESMWIAFPLRFQFEIK